jgi:transposase InsO family protein
VRKPPENARLSREAPGIAGPEVYGGDNRIDNGVPFASPNALFGLSKLSVWWLRLGIEIERKKPGHPQQNGRHERMHLTLKLETSKPAGRGLPDLDYPFHDKTVTVTTCGRSAFNRQEINLSGVFAGQSVGINRSAMIWGTLTSRHAGSNRSLTPWDQKCYLCLQNET